MTTDGLADAPDRTVASVMTMDAVSVPDGTSLAAVAELLDAYRISGAPVVDARGTFVGVVSQTDLVRLRAAGPHAGGWHSACVDDVMTSPPITISSSAPLAQAARRMVELGIHRLVVVDETDEPIGVVSESDIVRDIAESCDG
jgi:CBS domain-containing protein